MKRRKERISSPDWARLASAIIEIRDRLRDSWPKIAILGKAAENEEFVSRGVPTYVWVDYQALKILLESHRDLGLYCKKVLDAEKTPKTR